MEILTLCFCTGEKWFHKPGFSILLVILSPQGDLFLLLKAHVPMGNTMETVGIVNLGNTSDP